MSILKVIHLNTYAGNGGAGRACLRLNKALIDQGIDSQIWVNFSFEENNQVSNFSTSFFRKWITAAGIILEGLISKVFTKRLRIPFSIPIWGRDVSNHAALKQADIIHIHWINHAFLRPRDLAKLARLDKPIVWTFHDVNACTGGCHYTLSCTHYQQECGNCPVLKWSNDQDWSRWTWQTKYQAYQHLNFQIIAPSKWMADFVRSSKLLSSRMVQVIPNTLDMTIFKPTSKEEAKKSLGITPNQFVLISGSMPSRQDLYKGASYLLEAIPIFVKQFAINPEQIELLIFGNRDQKSVPDFGIKTTFLGTISDDMQLALCYSAADVFLIPSIEDNLPNTVMESLACGTPVVAFTTGGIPDMVLHQQNGYLAAYKSSNSFAAGINWIYQHPQREKLNIDARRTVEDLFSEALIAKKHKLFYQQVLDQHVSA